MTNFEIMGPYVIALLMSIGAVCVFVWAVLSGALAGTDDAATRFYRAEMENERTKHAEQAGE